MFIWFFQVKKNKRGPSMSPVVSPIKISLTKRKRSNQGWQRKKCKKMRPVAKNAFSLGFVEF